MRAFPAPVLMLAVLCLWGTEAVVEAQTFSGELLSNPGAENGDLAGWTRVSGLNFTTPSVDGGTYDPGYNPHTGSWQFVGDTYPVGGGPQGGLTQTVDISAVAGFSTAAIDAGDVAAEVIFWEQSYYQGTQDYAHVQLTFLGASNEQLGTVASPDFASANGGGGVWTSFVGSYTLPTGTRSIVYTMEFFRANNGGSYIDAFIDDNSLRLGPLLSVPEPAGAGMVCGALAGLVAWAAVRRTRPNPILRSRNG